MNNIKEIYKRIDEHFKNLTAKQFSKNIKKAGYDTYKNSQATIFNTDVSLVNKKED